MKISGSVGWMKVRQFMFMRRIDRERPRENVEPTSLWDNIFQTSLTNLLRYKPLVASILDDNRDDAYQFLTNDREALTAKLNIEEETALHIAVKTNKSNDLMMKLIEMMPINALFIVDKDGRTAFLLAVEKDNIEVVEFLLTKQPELPYVRCKIGKSPLQIAAQIGSRRMVSTLLLATKAGHSPYGGEHDQFLLDTLLEKKLYGAVTELLHRHPKLRGKRNQKSILLLNNLIENQPFSFFSGYSFSLMERLFYFCIPTPQVPIFQFEEERIKNQTKDYTDNEAGNSLSLKVQRVSLDLYLKFWIAIGTKVPYFKKQQEMKLMHQEAVKFVEWTCMQFTRQDYKVVEETFKGPLVLAATLGIEEIVQQILDFFPISIDNERIGILKSVVSDHHAYIFKLKNHRSYFKQMAIDYKDDEGNNILHLAGRSAIANTEHVNRSSVFQIFYELQWLKEMEKLVPPSYRVMKNKNGKTAEMIFVETHEELLTNGERRLNEIATYWVLVSAAIGTYAFGSAVFVRVNSTKDDMYIYRETAVMFYSFADALSIILSNISLFMFLVILMSRYTYRDFHRTLPQRFIMAITSLILSLLSIIIASIVIYLAERPVVP